MTAMIFVRILAFSRNCIVLPNEGKWLSFAGQARMRSLRQNCRVNENMTVITAVMVAKPPKPSARNYVGWVKFD
jgi:hypothetical protein